MDTTPFRAFVDYIFGEVIVVVQEKGKYKLIEDYKVRTACSISNLSKNKIINITQIDKKNKKVIGPELFDWVKWDMPVEKV